MEDNEIRIVLNIPLINTKEQYEVYKVHNLPLPLYSISKNETTHPYSGKYELETEVLMVSEDIQNFHCYLKTLTMCVIVITCNSVTLKLHFIR